MASILILDFLTQIVTMTSYVYTYIEMLIVLLECPQVSQFTKVSHFTNEIPFVTFFHKFVDL